MALLLWRRVSFLCRPAATPLDWFHLKSSCSESRSNPSPQASSSSADASSGSFTSCDIGLQRNASATTWPSLVFSRGYARQKNEPSTSLKPKSSTLPETRGNVRVVLLRAVPALGGRGSVVEANAGWVRHVLFPKGQAVYATPENVEKHSMTADERLKLEDPVAREQRRLSKLINSLATLNVNVSRRNQWWKETPDGMIGSVTAWDVLHAAELQYGIRLHESHLMMDGPITSFGTFKVPLNLRTKEDRQVELSVTVNSVRWVNHGHASS